MSQRILWALCIGFLLGVFIRSFVDLSWPFAATFILLGAGAYIYQLTDISKRNVLVVVAVACIACGAGLLRMDVAHLVGDPALTERVGENVVIEGVVVAEPDVRERNVRLHVRANAIMYENSTTSVNVGVLVIAPPHSAVVYGDIIRAKGALRLPQSFDTSEGRVFDYPMFLAKDGILYELAFAEVEATGENRGSIIKKIAIGIKRLYLSGLQKALPEPEAGLAGGITVGDKRSIGEELTETFREVSLVHIIVLSGYNMTVVMNAAARSLVWIPRTAQFAVSGAIVLLFVLMTGGAASATRAGAMALIAAYARLTGRLYLALRVLAAVALAMVVWNPYVLAYDPGFQLSVLATAGLVLFTPIFSTYLRFLPERYGLREIAASTIATQIAVLPLLLYQNGLLSIVSIPANLLALVVVPAAMAFSFAAAIAGAIFGAWGAIFALPALALLKYIIAVALFFGSLPFASVSIPAFSAWIMVAMYAALVYAYLVLKKKAPETTGLSRDAARPNVGE